MSRFSIVLTIIGCLTTGLMAGAQTKKKQSASKSGSAVAKAAKEAGNNRMAAALETVNPGVFLLRDPLVQADLGMTTRQRAAAAELAAEFNESVWRFRDASVDSEAAIKEARLLNGKMEPRLEELLDAGQRARLDGIILQVQGTDTFVTSRTAVKLSFTAEQQARISKLAAAAREAINDLREQSATSKDPATLNRQAESVQAGLQRDLLAVLTKSQRELWADLRGAPLSISKLQPLTAQAPELRGIKTWINSEPLSLEGLRGKVVVLHFWTFG